MKVHVDRDRCQGHGMCNAVAPTIYELDDLGYCAITVLEVHSGGGDEARHGAESCPEQAITVTD